MDQDSNNENSVVFGTSNIPRTDWKRFRPELHKKTFFKGATSLAIGMEKSLNLQDETAREIVKHAFKIVG